MTPDESRLAHQAAAVKQCIGDEVADLLLYLLQVADHSQIDKESQVWEFHGPHQRQVEARFASFGAAAMAVPISKTGKNALDSHLSFYMGYIASRNQASAMVAVANDKGYEPMLEHARSMGFMVRQVGHGPAQPAAAGAEASFGRQASGENGARQEGGCEEGTGQEGSCQAAHAQAGAREEGSGQEGCGPSSNTAEPALPANPTAAALPVHKRFG